jgi:hypothetical protein
VNYVKDGKTLGCRGIRENVAERFPHMGLSGSFTALLNSLRRGDILGEVLTRQSGAPVVCSSADQAFAQPDQAVYLRAQYLELVSDTYNHPSDRCGMSVFGLINGAIGINPTMGDRCQLRP